MKIKISTLRFAAMFIYFCSLSAFQRDTVFESALEIVSFMFFVGITALTEYKINGKNTIKISGMAIWYGTFILFSMMSSMWAVYSASAVFFYIKKMLQILIAVECISLSLKEKKDIEKIMKILLASLVLSGVLLILRTPINSWGTERMGEAIGLDKNMLGVRMAIGLLMSVYFLMKQRKKIYYVVIALSTLLLLFSGSKKAILMAAIGICVIGIFSVNSKKISKLLSRVLLIGIILATAWYLIFNNDALYFVLGARLERTFNYFLSGGQTIDNSTAERLYYISVAKKLFTEHPLIGVGLNNFKVYIAKIGYSHVAYSHCNYWELLSCLGIIGTVLFYSFHLNLLWKMLKLFQKKRNPIVVLTTTTLILYIIFDYANVSYMNVFQYIVICLIYNYEKMHRKGICNE